MRKAGFFQGPQPRRGNKNPRLWIEALEPRQLLTTTVLANGDFSAGLSGWTNESSLAATASVAEVGGNPQAILQPTAEATARISQQVAVAGNTDYQLSGQIVSEEGAYGYFGVKGFDGKWSEVTAGDNVSGEYTVAFTTAADTAFVTVYAQAYRQQTGAIGLDAIRLVPAASEPPVTEPPVTEPPVTEPPVTEPPITEPPVTEPPITEPPVSEPPVSEPGANALANGDFSAGLSAWIDESSLSATASVTEVGGNPQAILQPTAEATARISQQVAVAGNTDYQLSGQIVSEEGAYGYFGVKGFDGKWSEVTAGDNVSGEYTVAFTTAADTAFVTVYAQAYRQQTGAIGLDAIRLVPAASEPPVTEPPVTEPPVTEPPVTEPPVTEPPVTEPPVTEPPVSEPPVTEPTFPGPDEAGNWVQGGAFSDPLHPAWTVAGSVAVVPSSDGNPTVQLLPGATASSRAEQIIRGLRPETLYTFATRVRTEGEGMWASFGVDLGTQLPKTNAASGDAWQEKRFIFYTATGSTEVRLFLEAYQGQTGEVYFDEVRIVEGPLPLPAPPTGTEWAEPPELPELVAAGEEMIANADFAEGLEYWVTDHTTWQEGGEIILEATDEETARTVQDIPFSLAPDTTYTLTARVRATGDGATLSVTDRDALTASLEVTNTENENLSLSFTTDSAYRQVRVVLEQYKGSGGTLSIQNISLLATGGEWLDTPDPTPEPTTAVLYDNFDAGLDPEKWLIVDKAWGGDNGGLVPENVEIQDGVLMLHAHGDGYEGDVVGHNDRTTRVGAGIATRDYYASGRYEVRARIPESSGAASAFWTFHYVEHFPSEEEYWEEPSRVRNSEIDWEFPTALQTDASHDPISFDNARVNSWGGKLGGEGAHHPGRVEVVNDGEFHTYGIDWHSGGDGELPRVIWTLDGEEVYRHEGSLFGQDNIPAQASRFWLGIWFPAAGYKEQIEGEYVDRVGWAGDPDFAEATLEIDWVRITPFNEVNDRWEAETWPNGWYALPHEYPEPSLHEKQSETEALTVDAVLADWSDDPLA